MSSPTKYPEIWAALSAPFTGRQVRTRPGGRGKELSYITARTAMNRLDEILGPENWSDVYAETRDGLMCSITVTLPGGERVTKTDGGGFADMPEEDNVEKSAYSDAFKRACVKLGVARYLYQDGTPDFGNGHGHAPAPNGHAPATDPAPQTSPRGDSRDARPPTSGKALFAWASDQGKKFEVDVVKWLDQWGRKHNLPGKFLDWPEAAVADGHRWAVDRLNTLIAAKVGKGEAYEDDAPAR